MKLEETTPYMEVRYVEYQDDMATLASVGSDYLMEDSVIPFIAAFY